MTESRTTNHPTNALAIPSADGGLGPGRAVALLLAAVALSIVASMIITAGRTSPVTAGDTIAISMTEFAYSPDPLELPAGNYTFAITNDGAVPHEWMLSASGSHDHHLATTRQLASGETQEVEVTLGPGTYEYACHIPGHFEAGMNGTIRVSG